MNRPEHRNLSRKAFLATTVVGTASLLLHPASAFADDGASVTPDVEAIHLNDLISFEQQGNELSVTVLETGESATGYLSNNRLSIDIIADTGEVHHGELRSDGTIYIDGVLAYEQSNSQQTQTRAVPSGYIYLTTYRTNTVVTGSVASLALALLGLLPGIGSASAIASVLLALQGMNGEVAYIEVVQYYHPNTYYIYEVTRLYRNANYTGLIDTVERGPFPPV